MNWFTEILITIFFLFWIIDRLLMNRGKRDESDEPGKGEKSGLLVRTDYGTGVQYLEAPYGGLTVRVDADGKPMRAK